MSKYFYKGTDLNDILGDYTSGDNRTNLPENVNNFYNGILRPNLIPPAAYIETTLSNLNGGSHLNLGYKINGKDIYSYGVAPTNGVLTTTQDVTAPSWANHFTAYTVGGGGGGGGGGGKVGNGNGYDGGGGGGGAGNFYRLYALNGQRTMKAVVGGGGGGGQIGGTNGGGGGESYIEIDNVIIAKAGGGSGGAKGNADPYQIDTNTSTNIGGGGGIAYNYPLDITLMSVNSGMDYTVVKGAGGAGGRRDGLRNVAAGGSGIYYGGGGYGGRGSNANNQFTNDGYGGEGQAGSVRIWWFGGYR
jgi:hypothetical protein